MAPWLSFPLLRTATRAKSAVLSARVSPAAPLPIIRMSNCEGLALLVIFMQLIELIEYKVKSAAALCVLMDTPTLNARISENSIERDP